MYISYDYYRIFYYVAKYRSFTQAANALLNNQPNITRAIKNLEGELGCKLFVRSNRGVTLTPEGERLYEHISIAFRHIETAENELLMDKGLQSGCISIGASEVALHCFLLPVLKEFREKYPGVRIRVSNHSTPQAISALKDGLIDLAVVTTPVDVPKTAKMTVLKEIQEMAVCGTAYSYLTENLLSIKDLSNYPIICLGNQTKTYELYTDWFANYGLELKPDIEAATADQILPLVKNDLGIGFVPEEFLKNESKETGVYRLNIKEKVPSRSVCLIKGMEHRLSIAADTLEKLLLQKRINKPDY
ncbi:MAG: LysR family transcriptional regulator [Lachnospiraceae bacterium]|nr:LysR family transcriptional regulator [Lachnospiraceae bacterium]